MMTAHPFPGTNEELFRMAEAAAHHCTCAADQPTCSAHAMLMDETLTKRLVFASRRLERLMEGEFNV